MLSELRARLRLSETCLRSGEQADSSCSGTAPLSDSEKSLSLTI